MKRRLEHIRDVVSELDSELELEGGSEHGSDSGSETSSESEMLLQVSGHIMDLLEADLSKLLDKEDNSLNGEQGFIDYYAPNAEEQITTKKNLLEKYIHYLSLTQSVLVCLSRLKKNQDELITNTAMKPEQKQQELRDIQLAIDSLIQVKDPAILQNRKDIIEITEHIEAMNRIKKSLRDKPDDQSLQNKIRIFDDEMKQVKGYKAIKKLQEKLQIQLDKHINLSTIIPTGMLDVKRALSFLNQSRLIEKKIKIQQQELDSLTPGAAAHSEALQKLANLKTQYQESATVSFSSSAEEDKQIKEMLDTLRKLMANSIKEYQALAVAGGDINVVLHQTTGFYWDNLLLYRVILESITQSINNAAHLTAEGRLVSACMNESLSKIPSQSDINEALQAVAWVDKQLSSLETTYKGIINNKIPIMFCKNTAADIAREVLKTQKGPYFLIPYNSNSYVLDHPAHVDLVGALGNCYGETHMFLQRINGKNPTINNICPETDLINYQLEQTKAGSVHKPKVLGTYEVDSKAPDNEKVSWNAIKNLLTMQVDSAKNGDLCWLKLSGATVPGHNKPMGHSIGFIKMANPAPYKYIVYDYNLGAMGFSSDEQLQLYFEKIFDGPKQYYKFSKCVLEKIAEVSDECQQFFNGPQGVKPLLEANPNQTCERQYWNKEKVLMLLQYAPTNTQFDVSGLVAKINLLNLEDRKELNEYLLSHSVLELNNLLTVALKLGGQNTELLEMILKQLNQNSSNFKFQDSNFFTSPAIAQKVVNLIQSNDLKPDLACKLFPECTEILTAAYQKDHQVLNHIRPYVATNMLEEGKISNIHAVNFISAISDLKLEACNTSDTKLIEYCNQQLDTVDNSDMAALIQATKDAKMHLGIATAVRKITNTLLYEQPWYAFFFSGASDKAFKIENAMHEIPVSERVNLLRYSNNANQVEQENEYPYINNFITALLGQRGWIKPKETRSYSTFKEAIAVIRDEQSESLEPKDNRNEIKSK